MDERLCLKCRKAIHLPHIRVWVEQPLESHMLCFCDVFCMLAYYTNRHINDVPNFMADEYGRLPILEKKSE